MYRITLLFTLTLSVVSYTFAQQRVKVMTYNLLNFPNSDNTNTLGNDASRIGYFREIVEDIQADVIILQELTTFSGANSLINALNNSPILSAAGKTYDHATLFVTYPIGLPDGTGNMLIYNSNLFSLGLQQNLPRANATFNGINYTQTPRASTAYRLDVNQSVCGTNAPSIYFIGAHLKAQDGTDNAGRRVAGADDIMRYINNTIPNPSTANIVFLGDMNFYRTSEGGYRLLLNGQVSGFNSTYTQSFIDKQGNWTRNSSSNKNRYTQSTRTSQSQFGNGGVQGGLDDRFDFILVNEQINNASQKVSYVNNSYENFGVSTVPFNGAASSSSNPLVNTAIHRMSDHYPVVAELELDCTVATCAISNPSISGAVCDNENFVFDINFTPSNGSGLYQVRRVSNDAVIATGSVSPIQVELEENMSNTPFDVYVTDANDANCFSSNVTVTPQNCIIVPCDITNISISNALCDGENFVFNVNFTPSNGSGLYQVRRASNDAVLGTRSISPIQVELEENSSTTPFDIYVTDANDLNCFSSNVTVTPQDCINPTNCGSNLNLNANPIAAGLYKSVDSIRATGTIQSNTTVNFQAEQLIRLLPNFTVQNGSMFTATIANCTSFAPITARATTPTPSIQLYPNPAGEQVIIRIKNATPQPHTLQLIDLFGRVAQVMPFCGNAAPSTVELQVDVAVLPVGQYVVLLDGKVVKRLGVVR